MARLEIHTDKAQTHVVVTLSRRNLLTLLHKLDMPGSFRTITNSDCTVEGEFDPSVLLVLRCEDDVEHYAKRSEPPGVMHPASESFIRGNGGWSKVGD
jgi:hypothetical protein